MTQKEFEERTGKRFTRGILYNLTILQRLGNIVQDSLLRLNGVPKKAAGLDGMAL